MSVTLYENACTNGLLNNYESSMSHTPSEPLFWNYKVVSEQDSNGNPTVINYFLNDVLQFTQTYTYDASNNVISLTIS